MTKKSQLQSSKSKLKLLQSIPKMPSIGPSNSLMLTDESICKNSLDLTAIRTASTDDADPRTFLKVRGYELRNCLGKGAFAAVFKAKMIRDKDKFFAIKIFELGKVDRFWMEKCLKNEMYISKNLKHQNIILTIEVMKTRHHGFIVMALANGSLKSDMYDVRKKAYTVEQAKTIFRGLINGLMYIHQQNVAHRDLKLENFLLSADRTPMIADFGLAACGSRQSRTTLTQMLRKTPCGTPGYMAPEMFAKVEVREYDAKAVDIFAMGVTLYEMLNFSKPYPETCDEITINKIINQNFRYVVNLPSPLRELISSMLDFNSSRRPKIDQVFKNQWLNPNALTTFTNILFGNH
ncbi:hypothetical protein BLOT_001146 [Blomia tropicalis]|nr:hypothetical protein BLOT_001146 [Blomia tropicalis]